MSAVELAPGAVELGSERTATSQRLGNLDVLRALSALGILAIHAYAFGGRAAPIRAQHFYDIAFLALASGVWLFFVISGYVIARPFVDRLLTGRPLPSISRYGLRRVFRIYPLYWVALVAVIAIEGTARATNWQLLAHIALVNNLIPGRQEALFSTAWTLTVEVLFYLSVPLLALAMSRARALTAERLAGLVVLSWFASIVLVTVADTQGDGTIAVWLRESFFGMWQGFCPGILLAIAPHLTSRRWRRWLIDFPQQRSAIAVMVGLLVAGSLLSAVAPLRYGINAYQFFVDITRPMFAIGYGLLVARALRARSWSRPGRPLLELGMASYGIYLVHPVIEAFMLRNGLSPVPHDTLLGYLVNLMILLALTIPLALASWRWLERPAVAFAKSLGSAGLGRGGRDRRDGRERGDPAGPPASDDGGEVRRFWNDRAREDAFYFVDTRQRYRDPDPKRFWESADLVDYVLDGLGVTLTGRETVVEIGCGLGRITRGLAERASEVLAIDVSDEMLARARQLNPHLANVRWVLGDGRSLQPVADQSADACVSVVVLQHVPDPEITLGYIREVGRVLRAGGWAALQVSNDPAIHRPRDGIWLRLRARLGRAPGGQRHPAWLGSHVELPAVRDAATDAGLELRKVWGEGTQYCQLLLVKPPEATP